jgi:hypothetical protein
MLCILSRRNRAEYASLGGGSWVATSSAAECLAFFFLLRDEITARGPVPLRFAYCTLDDMDPGELGRRLLPDSRHAVLVEDLVDADDRQISFERLAASRRSKGSR